MKRSSEPPKTAIAESRPIKVGQSTSFESSQSHFVSGPGDSQASSSPRQARPHPSMSNPNTQHPASETSSEELLSMDQTEHAQQLEGTDIREVLKDLQLLSASLLGLETGQASSVNL